MVPLSSEETCKTNKCIMTTSQEEIRRRGLAPLRPQAEGYLRASVFTKALQEVECTCTES